MTEKISSHPEKSRHGSKEKLTLSAEQRAERSENKSEQKAEHEGHERETRAKLERSLDRQAKPEAQHDTSEQAKVDTGEPRAYSRKELDMAFRKTMTDVRAQLPPLQRSFSKFAHAKPVETISELVEETIYRPSFLWGGVLGGLLFGGGLVLTAYLQGYRLSGSEFIIGLLGGGILGLLVEFLFRGRRRKS